jgi:hypothetical protein
MRTLQETHRGLKKELQYEGQHDGKDDRACHVDRCQAGQYEQTSEKERLRIRRQGHLDLIGRLRLRPMGFRRASIPGR